MAQNDMHVIMYRILAYLYACLKGGRDVDTNVISCDVLGINERYWLAIVTELVERGYVRGISITHADNHASAFLHDPTITMTGVEFLMENSMMAKARRFLQDIKASVPGL